MITVYTQEDCNACRYSKKFLAQHNIAYTEIDVTGDDDMRDELVAKGFREMPVVVTDTGSWSGYRRKRLKALAVMVK